MTRFELLGGLRVTRNGEPLDSLLTQRRRCAIAIYLVVERDVSREAVLRLFWPDYDAERARHVLSQTLYQLRQTLGEQWLDAHGERLVVRSDVGIDAHELEALAARDVQRACALYRGSFLANTALVESAELEHWIDSKRAHYAMLFRKLVRDAIADHVANGALEAAIAIALSAAEAEPLEDEYHHRAIELLARTGKRGDALRHYELYQKLLRDSDLAPLEETVALVERIHQGTIEAAPLEQSQILPDTGAPSAPLAPWRWRLSAHRTAAVVLASTVALALVLPFVWSGKKQPVFTADANLMPDRVVLLPFDAVGVAARIMDAGTFHSRVMAQLVRSPQIDMPAAPDVDRALSAEGSLGEIAQATRALLVVAGSITTADTMVTVTISIFDGGTTVRLMTREFAAPQRSTAVLEQQVVDYLSDQLPGTLRVLAHRREAQQESAWQLFNEGYERFRSAEQLLKTGQFDAAMLAVTNADSLLGRAETHDPDWIAPPLLRVSVALRAAWIARHSAAKRTPAEAQQWFIAAIGQGDRALARKPGNVDALEALGIAKYEYWRWRASEQSVNDIGLRQSAQRDLQRVISADTERSRAWIHLAAIENALGRFREEKRMALTALEVDPTSSRHKDLFYRLGMSSLELGQDSEALNWCRTGRRRFPDYTPMLYCEAYVYAYGNTLTPDIAHVLEIVNTISAPENIPYQTTQVAMFEMLAAAALARAGLADSARAVARRASARAPGHESLLRPEAAMWTRLGDYERALDLLEVDAKEDPVWMLPTLLSQAFLPLRGEPRYRRLLARFNDT